MNNLTQIDEQETNLVEVENQHWIDKYHALVRLYDNPDFQLVITEGYFQEKAVNSVSMLANPGVVRDGARGEIMEELVAISRLQDYFIVIRNLGRPMEDDADDEQA
jgi:hypothetical protein